jgi:hypothetical protein
MCRQAACLMSHVAFAERGFNNSVREVFDLGKHRLKSGHSAAILFIGFAAKNLWIQFLGRNTRMAQELPKKMVLRKAASGGQGAETDSNCLVRSTADIPSLFGTLRGASRISVFTIGS